MTSYRVVFRKWMALLIAVALLAACGASNDGDAENGANGEGVESTVDSQGGSGNESGDQPKRGGEFVAPEVSDGDTLDFHASAYANVHQRVGLASSRLLKPDLTGDFAFGEAPLTGDLAESWDISEDGLTYTFRLRDDVVWHDIAPVNGRAFVADDIVATFERVLEGGVQKYMLENVTSVEATDDHTVVLKLSAPFAPLLNYMGNHQMWIMPREGVDGEYDVARQVIGTGPFVMTHWDRDIETVYEANPHYYEQGIPYVDSVRMPVIPEQGSRVATFRSGAAHVIAGISPEETSGLLSGVAGAQLNEVVGSSPAMMFVNMEREPFSDLRVRQAISMAVDRRGLGETLFGSGRLSGPVNAHLANYALSEEELERLIPYDPETARDLLTEAGYTDGFKTTIMVSSGYGQNFIRAAEWVVADLADIGIDAEIDVVDQATYSTRRPEVQYDMGVGPSTPFQEPDEWLRAQYHIDGNRNWWNINDPKLDAMLEEQASTVNEGDRRELILDIQRYILAEVVNPMHLWLADGRSIIQPGVQNWRPQPQYGYGHYAYLWLDE